MPPWFIDIESATEIEAKSNATPPASRTAAHAARANPPSSALHGVTRPSVEATPTNGFWKSRSCRPSARRNARCGARSSPSTVMREGSFFVVADDFIDACAVQEAELGRAPGEGGLRRAVHHLLQGGIGLEADFSRSLRLDDIPHLLRAGADAGQQDAPAIAQPLGRNFTGVPERLDHPAQRDAGEARLRLHRADVVASGKRLADDRARPAGNRGVRGTGAHQHRGKAQRAAI